MGGKADWLAGGLPVQGHGADHRTLLDVVRRDAPTCGLGELIGEARKRVAAGWTTSIVVNAERVVLGELEPHALHEHRDLTAEQAMASGPTTLRPDVRVDDTAKAIRDSDVDHLIVTSADGRLIGVVPRKAIEQALQLAGNAAGHHH